MTDVYAAVDNLVQSGTTKAAVVCEVLKLSRSAYDAWRTGQPSARDSRDVELAAMVRDIFLETSPTLWKATNCCRTGRDR